MANSKRPAGAEPVVDAGTTVNAYRMLGLKPGESNPHEIRRAIDQTRLRMEERSWGPDGEKYRKSLAALGHIEAILTDPTRKQAFDERLPAQLDEVEPLDQGEEDEATEGENEVSDQASAPANVTATSLPEPQDRPSSLLGRLDSAQKQKLSVAIVGFVLMIGLIVRAVFMGPNPFPEHRSPPPALKGSNLASPRMAPAPPKSTAPGLTLGVPKQIPGLERISDASEPTLSGDLKMIVFTRSGRGTGGSDLFFVTRVNPSRPFLGAEPLKICNTGSSESSPTLARDSLELMFLRDGEPFVTTRPSVKDDFRDPVPLVIPGANLGGNEQIDALRLLADGLCMTVRISQRDHDPSKPPRYLIAERASQGAPFERSSSVSAWFPWSSTVFSADTLRQFAVTPSGVSLASRVGRESEFGKPGLVQTLTPDKIGVIDGSFWISQFEDVLVYASSGIAVEPGKSGKTEDLPNDGRSLWMVRFR